MLWNFLIPLIGINCYREVKTIYPTLFALRGRLASGGCYAHGGIFCGKDAQTGHTFRSLIICTARLKTAKLVCYSELVVSESHNLSLEQKPSLQSVSPTIIVHSTIVALRPMVRPLAERTINVAKQRQNECCLTVGSSLVLG